MKKLLHFVCFICFFGIFLSGCSTVPIIGPIITGIVMWKDGEASKYYNEEAHTLYRSVKISLEELNYQIFSDENLKDGGNYIVAGDNDKFKIFIRQVKPHITEVKIRVNFLGDKPYADLLYEQIDLNTSTIDFDNQGKPTKRRNKKSKN